MWYMYVYKVFTNVYGDWTLRNIRSFTVILIKIRKPALQWMIDAFQWRRFLFSPSSVTYSWITSIMDKKRRLLRNPPARKLQSLWLLNIFFAVFLAIVLTRERKMLGATLRAVTAASVGSKDLKSAINVTALLQSVSSRFYVYENDTIAQSHRLSKLRPQGIASNAKNYDHLEADMEGERRILLALMHHPLRTMNPDKAEIFIVPTPVTALLAYGCQWEDCTWYDEAFGALREQPPFVKHHGHNHVIIAQSWPIFNKRYSAFIPALSRNYRLLENVTVANNYDPFGCLHMNNLLSQDPSIKNDFKGLYEDEMPETNAFALGFGYNRPFPVQFVTLAKFNASKYYVFHHTREEEFGYGSTRYRRALLNANDTESLPFSSIGHDISKKDWESAILSSKFCLIIRGDTPHSHSLMTAVRAGCIPVIVSDNYQAYAGPFKSSLSTSDFSIYIDEASFLRNPVGELGKLQDLSLELIKGKLEQLAMAQTVLMPDHPQSLFVQAFVREAIASRANVLPQVAERAPIKVLEDTVTISRRSFMYRYPSTLTSSRTSDKTEAPVVIVGVLSRTENFNARHSIRNTWASKNSGRVFFILSGPWESPLLNEFELFGDIFWMDMPEEYLRITYKVQAFFHAVNSHVESYDYVIKTDDDSYVLLEEVEHHLTTSKPNYWGCCVDNASPIRDPSDKWYMSTDMWPSEHYPPYALGMAYALSRNFLTCATKYLEGLFFMKFEDVAIGLLADLCSESCSNSGWDIINNCDLYDQDFVVHYLEDSESMIYKHWDLLKSRKMGDWPMR